MKSAMNLATALLLSFGLVACGGGGGGSSSGTAAPEAPINKLALTKYDVDFIDIEDSSEKTFILASDKVNKKELNGLYGTLSVTSNPNGVNNPPAFEYKLTSQDMAAIAKEHKGSVEKLDAKFAGKLYAYLGNNHNEVTQRDVVFHLTGSKISGHSIKRSADDVQVRFQQGDIVEREGNPNPGVGFNGKVEIAKGNEKPETGNYFGYFFGAGTDVKGLTGEFDAQKNHQGRFFADREGK